MQRIIILENAYRNLQFHVNVQVYLDYMQLTTKLCLQYKKIFAYSSFVSDIQCMQKYSDTMKCRKRQNVNSGKGYSGFICSPDDTNT